MPPYDVIIIGAGFAGLTLSYQLLQDIPGVKIGLISDKQFPVPNITHTVGESLNELGGMYICQHLNLHDYMLTNHFRKMGMRFFKEKDQSFCEMGVNYFPKNDSFHFERGKFENDIYNMIKDKIDIFDNCKFVDFNNEVYLKNVTILNKKKYENLKTKWIVDASGLKQILSRKFNISRKGILSHSSAWVRLEGNVSVNDIYSLTQDTFMEYDRDKSSIHIEGKGYWIWILPLSEKATSLGIVFDDNINKFDSISSKEKFFKWINENSPILSKNLKNKKYGVLDFNILRKFSRKSDYATSEERWALTGDAYGFLDPYYSSGFDLIGIQNTMLVQNIKSDLRKKNINEKVSNNNNLLSSFMRILDFMFIDMYSLKDDWYYLCVKYCFDSITNFSSFCVILKNVDFSDDILVEQVNVLLEEIIDVYGKVTTFLRSNDFNKLGYKAPENFLLHPTLFSEMNIKINEPNGNGKEVMKALKKNLNIIKYEYYYIVNQNNYIDLLHSSIHDLISDKTDIEKYKERPLTLFQKK